ncbi:MAG: pyruvate dehydrogenase complex dihydrolipoamide acetyltransferase [Proteobacteria bacterium]|nr:pyruvate dehydrogenase complex dihydrolipoamide acetyltransferase [Pseudomonadota bacterium]
MPISILMPALSPTMTEGNLAKWNKKEGDLIKPGEVIAEIETDKATMEVEAVDEGLLAKILIPEGREGVKVNEVIAVLLEEGEELSVLENFLKKEKTVLQQISQSEQPAPIQSASLKNPTQRVFASPLARKIAETQHIDLTTLTGTGPHGRIVKADVEKALMAPPKPILSPVSASYTDIPLGSMRKTIAKRLTESKQTIPHFYLTIDCELDKLLALRSEINNCLQDQKISVNDFIVRAVALSLIDVPDANVAWMDSVLRQYHQADISVAVAIEGGLITPVVKSAHLKSLKELSLEIKALAERARAGKLNPEDYQGGTFTISNLGMYRIKQFEAIINPPQGCILAVGMGEKRPIIKKDHIEIATLMTVTLSVDHRAVDGAIGSKFLSTFKEYIENPLKLLL